jgi:hypothetical protein
MKKSSIFVLVLLAVATLALYTAGIKAATPAEKSPEWSMNATVIEACSCPMFCQCYFNAEPATHHHGEGQEGHFCKFNNAYKINAGMTGAVNLTGAKFWISGDLGGDFSQGQMDWAVLTFDKAVTKEQRDAIGAILGKLFPVKWNSFTMSEGDMTWEATKDAAHATLDGGKTAEVKLTRFQGMNNDPVKIMNLKYWGAARNDGFVLMPNQLEAYHVGPKAYEYKGTNGFMVTVDMKSTDYEAAPKGGSH